MKIVIKSIVALVMFTGILFLGCKKEGKVDDDSGFNVFSLSDDIEIGQQIAAEIESDQYEFPIVNEAVYPEAYQRMNLIRDKILATGLVNYTNDFEWRFKIIQRDDVVNAFALPGGYCYFYTGLIKLLDNEAQFAGVMAHEMVHCAHRHSTDQLTKAYGIELILDILVGDNSGTLAQIVAALAGGLTELAFSRAAENNADEYAVKYLYATDYHPPALADFFTILNNQSTTPIFLSTHPSDENRIEHINEVWTGLGGESGFTYQNEYDQFKASLP